MIIGHLPFYVFFSSLHLRKLCIVSKMYFTITCFKAKVLITKTLGVSCLSLSRISFLCCALDPSWASSVLCWPSWDFSLGQLAPKPKLFIEGSSRNCQPDGAQLVLRQINRLLKWTLRRGRECSASIFTVLQDIVVLFCYMLPLFLFNVISLPILTSCQKNVLFFLIWWVTFSWCLISAKLPSFLFFFIHAFFNV